MSINHRQLSKTLSLALRHRPSLFNLELDAEGWVAVDTLITALHNNNRKWQDVSLADIQALMADASKQRFELRDGQIRALYGHSARNSVQKTPAEPPALLWHGTPETALALILKNGLKPMSRQFVHMTLDEVMARDVAHRKGEKVILLSVAALEAHQAGVLFYLGNDNVWLADFVPPEYIKVATS